MKTYEIKKSSDTFSLGIFRDQYILFGVKYCTDLSRGQCRLFMGPKQTCYGSKADFSWIQSRLFMGPKQTFYGSKSSVFIGPKAEFLWVQSRLFMGPKQTFYGSKADFLWIQSRLFMGPKQTFYGSKADFLWIQSRLLWVQSKLFMSPKQTFPFRLLSSDNTSITIRCNPFWVKGAQKNYRQVSCTE